MELELPDVTNGEDVVAKCARLMLIHLVLKARPNAPDEEVLEVVNKLIDRYQFESELMWFMKEFDWCEFEQFTWPQPNRNPTYWVRPPEGPNE